MPRPPPPSNPPSPSNLEDHVRALVGRLRPTEALPTTRSIGRKLGVANTTAFRVLQRMVAGGVLWQHPTSGRFYAPAARALLDRPKPVACLIRRLELGSEQYRELLEGISQGCGALHRTMLLWHDELLVNHPEPQEPPLFASLAQQRPILADFLERHGGSAGGFILDHAWDDEALRGEGRSRLRPAVVLFRSSRVGACGNIRADFRAGALKALAHLLGRGFEQVLPAEPFAGDPAVAEFMEALAGAAEEVGCRERLGPVQPARTYRDRAALIQRLARARVRTAVICPEDNVAILLTQGVRAAGLACPERIGILSAMGTDFAAKAGLSCLRYDFRAMGRLAVEALVAMGPVHRQLEPSLLAGATT